MRRYRYITCGAADLDDPVSNYRLIAGRNLLGNEAIRIAIPDDLAIVKYPCDSYGTTYDGRKLRDLDPKAMAKIGGRWKEVPWLLSVPMHRWHEFLREQGIRATLAGYVPAKQ